MDKRLEILNKYIDFSKDGVIEREHIVKAMQEYADLQLQQTDVSDSYSKFPHKKVCFFKVENGKYLTDNGIEITNEMLIKHSHHIGFPWNYIVLE
jgi:hypothetical protein